MTDTAAGWVVVCEDGRRRHDDPFPTMPDARYFAEWGHCCTNRHRIIAAEPVPA